MNLTENQQTDLQEFAGIYLPLDKIARILEVDADELIEEYQKTNSQVRKLVDTGRLQTEAQLQKVTIQLAINGSVPALTTALKMMENTLRIEKQYAKNQLIPIVDEEL